MQEAEVMSSLSNNMIKAYQIAYNKENSRKLDMAEREQSILERIHELLPEQRFLEQLSVQETDGFVPGIAAEAISEIAEEEKRELTKEEYNSIKESIRQELELQMSREAEETVNQARQQAEQQAEQLLKNAKQDAEAAKAGILQLASAQGYEEGHKRAQAEYTQKLQRLEEEKLQLQQEYERRVSELEPAFVKILTELVKSITGISYENHEEVFLYLLDSAIHHAPKETVFSVYLNREELENSGEQLKALTEKYEGKLQMEFIPEDSLKKGECRLENDRIRLECGLGVRLQGLLDALDMMALT